MKTLRTVLLISAALILALAHPAASGLVGIYGIIERVAFEPNENAPERVQVWGAFAYANGSVGRATTWSPAGRGYLYFSMPASTEENLAMIRREWADFRAVAGTSQAVGFGRWSYIGAFDQLSVDGTKGFGIYLPSGGSRVDLRVRPDSETPANPAAYQTNAGVVRLPADGSHSALVGQLRAALKR